MKKRFFARKQRGAAILVIVFSLLGIISLFTLYSVNSAIIGKKVVVNEYKSQQAFEAAQAGLDYGIVYLQKHSTTIRVDSDSDGYINTNSFSQTLANGAGFTISYTNPTSNDFSLIKITSTGNSADNSAQRNVSELVKYIPALSNPTPMPLAAKNDVLIDGSSDVWNLYNDVTIWSGGEIMFKGSGQTHSNDGLGSDKNTTHTDIRPNDAALAALSDAQFFENFFGSSMTEIKGMAGSYYNNDSATNYNDLLDGQQGKIIWIDQTGGDATINGDATIGTQDNPVILVINGPLKINGNVTVYGIVYIVSDVEFVTGNPTIHGSVIANNLFDMSGSAEIQYNPTVMNNVTNGIGTFAKVPGSWKDF